MSIESLDADIEAKRLEFHALNQNRDRVWPYVTLPLETERAIVQLADEIARLQMTKSMMTAQAVIKSDADLEGNDNE